jgi:hypothetical protein
VLLRWYVMSCQARVSSSFHEAVMSQCLWLRLISLGRRPFNLTFNSVFLLNVTIRMGIFTQLLKEETMKSSICF